MFALCVYFACERTRENFVEHVFFRVLNRAWLCVSPPPRSVALTVCVSVCFFAYV